MDKYLEPITAKDRTLNERLNRINKIRTYHNSNVIEVLRVSLSDIKFTRNIDIFDDNIRGELVTHLLLLFFDKGVFKKSKNQHIKGQRLWELACDIDAAYIYANSQGQMSQEQAYMYLTDDGVVSFNRLLSLTKIRTSDESKLFLGEPIPLKFLEAIIDYNTRTRISKNKKKGKPAKSLSEDQVSAIINNAKLQTVVPTTAFELTERITYLRNERNACKQRIVEQNNRIEEIENEIHDLVESLEEEVEHIKNELNS